MNRRNLVHGAVAAGVLAASAPWAAERPKTPRDFTGPFYPRGARNRTNDLIVGAPRTELLHLRGRVLTPGGLPHAGALVDIWHADPQGRYKHPRDRGQDELMDEFLYWGEAVTDGDGRFRFRSYVPGSYSARPAPHIHYKIWSNRQEILTSQIYFDTLGSDRGLARSDAAATLQTARLVRADQTGVSAAIDIVI